MLHSVVVGMRHRASSNATALLLSALGGSQEVALRRDHFNPVDSNAIQVVALQQPNTTDAGAEPSCSSDAAAGHAADQALVLGHLPAALAAQLAPLMDQAQVEVKAWMRLVQSQQAAQPRAAKAEAMDMGSTAGLDPAAQETPHAAAAVRAPDIKQEQERSGAVPSMPRQSEHMAMAASSPLQEQAASVAGMPISPFAAGQAGQVKQEPGSAGCEPGSPARMRPVLVVHGMTPEGVPFIDLTADDSPAPAAGRHAACVQAASTTIAVAWSGAVVPTAAVRS